MKAESNLSTFNFTGILLILGANLTVAFILEYFCSSTWVLAAKDYVILVLLLVNVLFVKKIPWGVVKLIAPLLLYLALVLIGSAGPAMPVFAALRQILVPYLIIILGWYVGNSLHSEQIRPALNGLTLFLLLGTVVFYILAVTRWLPINEYSFIKSMELDHTGLPFMFEDSITGTHIRNAGTFFDPINLGHALLFLLVYGYYRKLMSKALLVFAMVAMLLTVCKGAILQLAMVVFVLELKLIPRWARYVTILLGLIVLLFLFKENHGVNAHIQGILTALENLSLFGEGIGQVGNQAVLFGNDSALPIYDTFLGSVLGQVGLVGLILWIAPFFLISKFKESPILNTILMTQLIIAAVSENAFNFLSVFLLLLMIGIQMNFKERSIDGA